MNYLANFVALERLHECLNEAHAANRRQRWLRYWWSRRALESGEPFAGTPPQSARPSQLADKSRPDR